MVNAHWKAFASDGAATDTSCISKCESSARDLAQAAAMPTLKWEFVWLLKDVGYESKGKTTSWKYLSDNFSKWSAWVERAGFNQSRHLGKSRASLLRSEGMVEELSTAKQEHWCSSEALLTLLSWWAVNRREVEKKKALNIVGRLFVERLVDARLLKDGALSMDPPPPLRAKTHAELRLLSMAYASA